MKKKRKRKTKEIKKEKRVRHKGVNLKEILITSTYRIYLNLFACDSWDVVRRQNWKAGEVIKDVWL